MTLDRNSTYKVFTEVNGQLQRLRVPNCKPGVTYNSEDLVQSSYGEFINYKNRAFAVQARLSAGATVAYVAFYQITTSDFGAGVEICYRSTLFQELVWNEQLNRSILTPWVYYNR